MADRYVRPLPPNPSLEQQRKLARELLRDVHAGQPEALERCAALHPEFVPAKFQLSDAQLVIARGYGLPSWPALKARLEGLTAPPRARLAGALYRGDVAGVRELLESQPELRSDLNSGIGHFGATAAMAAGANLELLDLVLSFGADINARSDWWAGSFGVLDGVTPELAPALIARGARLDLYAAARLGWLDDVKRLIDEDPPSVTRRFGDGQTPLHVARTVEIAEYLLDHGAELEARCIDHESTPVQYAIGDRPEVARYLVDRGARTDIFLAAALGDLALVRRHLEAEPDCLDARINHGRYRVRHNGREPATPEQIGDGRGDIYRWALGHDWSPLDVARDRGHAAVVELMVAHSTPAQRLLDPSAAPPRVAARALLAEQPGLVAQLSPERLGDLAHHARDLRRDAVALMLELGWPVESRGQHGGTALHWAAWRGDRELVELLLAHDPPLEATDDDFGSTPLGWAVHASQHGWDLCRAEDYGAIVARLLACGCQPQPTWLPCGNEAVDAVLRAHFERS